MTKKPNKYLIAGRISFAENGYRAAGRPVYWSAPKILFAMLAMLYCVCRGTKTMQASFSNHRNGWWEWTLGSQFQIISRSETFTSDTKTTFLINAESSAMILNCKKETESNWDSDQNWLTWGGGPPVLENVIKCCFWIVSATFQLLTSIKNSLLMHLASVI